MNKKAVIGPAMMGILSVMCIIIIALALAGGFSIFNGSPPDFRKIDSEILNYKIRDCFSKNNFDPNSQTFTSDFFAKCEINQNVIESKYFFIYLDFSDGKTFTFGRGDQTQCALSEKNNEYLKCTNSTITEKQIFIQTGSNQQIEKIKT